MKGEVAAGGATPQAAGEGDRFHSGSDPKLHHEFHREVVPALSAVIAAALASGTLQGGGRFELRSGRLWREGAR